MAARARRPERALSALILAAGEGTRMKSGLAKVLHVLAGRPMIRHVTDAARSAGAGRLVVVVGVQASDVEASLDELRDARFVVQKKRRGTGDAVRSAEGALKRLSGDVLILAGDMPLIRASTLKSLVSRHRRSGAALTVLTGVLDDPTGYGRIVREGTAVRAIVEHKDADAAIRAIGEVNTGTYVARIPDLLRAVRRIRPHNVQREYYLTDAVSLLLDEGKTVTAAGTRHPEEAMGVNDMAQLAAAEARLRDRTLAGLMASGVRIMDPGSTWVDAGVRVGADTRLYPGVILEGGTVVGRGCTIHSGSRLRDVRVADGATILDHCVLVDSKVGRGAQIGPFAHLRPGTTLAAGVKVGNFVETKKATLGEGSKASHLAYLGDARIGKGVNVGAGTITCNYDGTHKHLTRLGDGVFIGSDSQLVAPVTVGKGAYVGAGSTITEDVPPGALGLSRPPQVNVDGWVERRKRRGRRKRRR